MGTETVTARAGWRGWNEDGNGGREIGREQGGKRGPGRKRSLLVEDVLEYWEVGEGDGAD